MANQRDMSNPASFSTGIQRMSIYETPSHFYVVGANSNKTSFRILKVDRTEPRTLTVLDDGIDYTQRDVQNLLACLNHGNLQKGKEGTGLRLIQSGWAIAGFIRFTEGYYMVVATKRIRVAMIGYHSIYKVEEAEVIPLEHASTRKPSVREQQYIRIFHSIDFKDNFYYSYTYDVTSTLQNNNEKLSTPERGEPSMKYVWNQHLLRDFKQQVQPQWVVYLVHGFVSQANLSVFGRPVFVTLICRRSNRFAGTRFLKRGSDESGHVANEIETEQVVADEHFRTKLTSFVQLRGSVPGYWSQESSKMVPKPPIVVNRPDPFAGRRIVDNHLIDGICRLQSRLCLTLLHGKITLELSCNITESAASHFNAVLRRYSWPVICLNLVKKNERHRHESLLIDELKGAVSYLNQFVPFETRIRYVGFDMARANKKGHALIALENIARRYIKRVGFFQSFDEHALSPYRRVDPIYNVMQNLPRSGGNNKGNGVVAQTGVIRTNCVDCIDRTNTAQFVIGKIALGLQLYALGIIDAPHVEYDCVASTLLEDLFEDAGNTIARQYGGSQMVHRLQSYRRRAWADHWKDSLQTFSRYYSNTFGDFDKQAAINLFLGIFEPSTASTGEDLWNLMSDVYLHHPALRAPLSVLQVIAEEIHDAARSASSPSGDAPTGNKPEQPAEVAQEKLERNEEERKKAMDADDDANKAQDDGVISADRAAVDAESPEDAVEISSAGAAEVHRTPTPQPHASTEKYTSLDSLSEMYRPWEFSWLRYNFRAQMPHTARDYARTLRECNSSAFAVPERLRTPASSSILSSSATTVVVSSSSGSVAAHPSDVIQTPAVLSQSPTPSSIQIAGDEPREFMGSQFDLSNKSSTIRKPEYSPLMSRRSRHSSVGQFLVSHSAALLFGGSRTNSSVSIREEDETVEKAACHTFGSIPAPDGDIVESTDDGSDGSDEHDSSDDGFDDGGDEGDDMDSDEFDEDDEALASACLRAQREHLRTNPGSTGSSITAPVFKRRHVLPQKHKASQTSPESLDFGSKKLADQVQQLPVDQHLKQFITTSPTKDIVLVDRSMQYDYSPPISATDMQRYEKYAALNKLECLQRQKADDRTRSAGDEPTAVLQPTRCLAAYFQHMRERWKHTAAVRLAAKAEHSRVSALVGAEISPTMHRHHLPSLADMARHRRLEFSSAHASSSVSVGKSSKFFYRDGRVSLAPAPNAVETDAQDALNRRNAAESFDERQILGLISRKANDAVALMRASVHEITPLCDYSAYGTSRQVQLKPVDEKSLDIYRNAVKLATSGVDTFENY